MKKKIILLIMILLMFPTVLASSDSCTDENTLKKTYNYSFLFNNIDLGNLSIPKYENCPNGCDNVTNACSPSQLDLTLWYIIGIFGFLFLIGILLKVWRR